MTALNDGCGSSAAVAAAGEGGQAGWEGELFVKCCGGPMGCGNGGTSCAILVGSGGVSKAADGG